MVDPFMKEEAIEVDQLEETNKESFFLFLFAFFSQNMHVITQENLSFIPVPEEGKCCVSF